MTKHSDSAADRVQRLLMEIGFDRVHQLLGVSRATFYNWRNGRSAPSVYQALRLLKDQGLPLSWIAQPDSAYPPRTHKMRLAYQSNAADERCTTLQTDDLIGDPLFESALAWYAETGGAFRDGHALLEMITPFSLVQAQGPDGIFDFHHFGAGSMAAAYYGVEHVRTPKLYQKVVDRDLEEWAARFYMDVIDKRKPACHDISKCAVASDVARMVYYRRLVLPVNVNDQDMVVILARETTPPRRVA